MNRLECSTTVLSKHFNLAGQSPRWCLRPFFARELLRGAKLYLEANYSLLLLAPCAIARNVDWPRQSGTLRGYSTLTRRCNLKYSRRCYCVDKSEWQRNVFPTQLKVLTMTLPWVMFPLTQRLCRLEGHRSDMSGPYSGDDELVWRKLQATTTTICPTSISDHRVCYSFSSICMILVDIGD